MSDQSLADLQTSQGAVFNADSGGANLPLDFGDPAAEYARAQDSAAVLDVSDRTQIEVTGGDRAKFLHNFCTNDVKALRPGQGCEAFVTNVKGRVLGHVFVFAAPESIWLESVAGAEKPLLAHLERYVITEDVVLRGRTADCGELFVTGPRSAASLVALNLPVESLSQLEHVKVESFEHPCFGRRVDLLGAAGFLLSAPRDDLAALWRRITDGGVRPAGTRAFEALRIEAGYPAYGRDVSDENIAQEAGRTTQAISFTKGCYLGQEPIARLDALGHTNRELRGLRLADRSVPAIGSKVTDSSGAQEVGRVTSAALAYADARGVALAYLRKQFITPGTELRVDAAGEPVPATVFWPHS